MTKKRLRVLHVIQNLNYGGMERLFADIVRLLDHELIESHVMVMDYLGRFGEGLEHYATIHKAPRMSRWSMVYPGALIRMLREINPDVVHTHSGVWYKVSLAARRARIARLIHTEHGRKAPDPWLDRFIGRQASRRTDVVVAVSEVLAHQLKTCVVQDPTRVVVVPNGVDTELHRPRPDTGIIRRELGLDADVPIIGSIGRLEPIKGYDIMVEAFALLRDWWPEGSKPPVLVVGGEGSDRLKLDTMIADRGLEGSAFLLGWRDDVADLHSAFTFFTMSSRSEGTSVSLLEAMSSGLTPVVTDVGGNAAVLGSTLRPLLVPSNNPAALAKVWLIMLEDGRARSAYSQRARARVQEGFSLEAMVQAYQRLYSKSASNELISVSI
jgi:glycosyltransferase involved in cell wall biosynthesis